MTNEFRAGALALLICTLDPALAMAEEADPTTASARGSATISVAPDRATLRIAVVTEHRQSEEAARANATKQVAVLDALREALGREAKIRTLGYSLAPQYDFPKAGRRELRGYLARNQVEVVTGQLDRVGAAIDAAAQAGANDVDSLRFGLADDLSVRLRALDEATRRARQKIDAMAAALGLRVERIVAVSEDGAGPVMPVQRHLMQAQFDKVPTPLEAGQLEVRASVVLRAELGS
jgi:uncharacterized protein YggE